MFLFTPAQRRTALVRLVLLHILIIASSNYLVQIPFELFGFHTTWGAFTFPFIFLATDLTVRIFGARLARRIIFRVMFPALLVSYLISVLFAHGYFAGFGTLATFDPFVARIAVASFSAYALGQVLDILVFNRLRRNQRWWYAPAASTVFANALDTAVFFAIAFHHSSDPFMASHWQALALADYGWKIVVVALFFLPAYGIILNRLTRILVRTGRYLPEESAERSRYA